VAARLTVLGLGERGQREVRDQRQIGVQAMAGVRVRGEARGAAGLRPRRTIASERSLDFG
jgi:hypothetical protein